MHGGNRADILRRKCRDPRWALGSGIEALASVIVVWRFTGSRMVSETERRKAGTVERIHAVKPA